MLKILQEIENLREELKHFIVINDSKYFEGYKFFI